MIMQHNDIKAFRQRLIRAGFKDVSIYSNFLESSYSVFCISPNGERIYKKLTLVQIRNIPRTVWFD